MDYYVYIMANKNRNVLYIGVTNDLIRRVYEHKHHLDPKSFTSQYNVEDLMYYEIANNPTAAIEREKQLKGWRRSKKETLINSMNPQWLDLYEHIQE